MLLALLLGLWATLLLAEGAPIGRWLRRWMVEAPAARLARVLRGTWITLAVLALIGAAMIWLMEGEGLRLAGMFAPEIAGWLTAFEVSAYVDALVFVISAGSALRFGAARHWIKARRPRLRAPRTRRVRVEKPANDDDDPAWALAA